MAYDFRCPTCGALLETEDRWVGKKADCPGCGANLVVPRKSIAFQQTKPCPNCGQMMRQNDVICEKCSFNIMTGKIDKKPLGYKVYKRKKIKDVMRERIVVNFPLLMLESTFYISLFLLGIGLLCFFILRNSNISLYVALALIITGGFFGIISYLMWLWAWLKSGIIWLLLCFFIPIVNLAYILVHWERAKYPLGVNLIAVIMVFSGGVLMGPRMGDMLKEHPVAMKTFIDMYISRAMKNPPRKITDDEKKELIRNRDSINKADETGWLPLQRAAYYNDVEFIKKLITRKADVEGGAKENMSPLMIAAIVANKDAVLLLLEAGADPMLQNKEGQSAFMLSFDPEIRKLIQDAVEEKQSKGI